jgi:acyl-coenzyme A synthetase/AMP-(fatty) acid ligase
MLHDGKAQALLHSPDQVALAQAAIRELADRHDTHITAHEWLTIPSISNLLQVDEEHIAQTELSYDDQHVSVAGILHSSGSTGNPKPIPFTNRSFIHQIGWAFEDDVLITTPLPHIYARYVILSALTVGSKAVLLHPSTPVTGETLFRVLQTYPQVRLYAVPAIISMIASQPGGIQVLGRVPGLAFSGGAVPSELGNRLVESGVML